MDERMKERKKELDLDKLEEVKVTFGKHAFAPKVAYCNRCNVKMKKIPIEISVSEFIKIELNGFKCSKCKKERLGLDEAEKLDKALVLNRLISKKQFTFKRRLSFDGDNYIFRLPNELTQGIKHKEVEIMPLESREALIKW